MRAGDHRDAILSVTVLAALAAVFLLLVFIPGQKRLSALEQQIKRERDIHRQIPRERAARQQQQRQIEAARQYAATAEERLVPPAELHAALRDITAAADAAELTVLRLEPRTRTEHATWSEQHLQLKFRGRYPAVMHFLQSVEQSPRLYHIRSLALRRESEEDSENLEGEVEISVCLVHADSGESADSDSSRQATRSDSDNRFFRVADAARRVSRRDKPARLASGPRWHSRRIATAAGGRSPAAQWEEEGRNRT